MSIIIKTSHEYYLIYLIILYLMVRTASYILAERKYETNNNDDHDEHHCSFYNFVFYCVVFVYSILCILLLCNYN